jgi:hypothetical protein
MTSLPGTLSGRLQPNRGDAFDQSAVIKGWILKKARPSLALPVKVIFVILMFLVLAFNQIRFFSPYL